MLPATFPKSSALALPKETAGRHAFGYLMQLNAVKAANRRGLSCPPPSPCKCHCECQATVFEKPPKPPDPCPFYPSFPTGPPPPVPPKKNPPPPPPPIPPPPTPEPETIVPNCKSGEVARADGTCQKI